MPEARAQSDVHVPGGLQVGRHASFSGRGPQRLHPELQVVGDQLCAGPVVGYRELVLEPVLGLLVELGHPLVDAPRAVHRDVPYHFCQAPVDVGPYAFQGVVQGPGVHLDVARLFRSPLVVGGQRSASNGGHQYHYGDDRERHRSASALHEGALDSAGYNQGLCMHANDRSIALSGFVSDKPK